MAAKMVASTAGTMADPKADATAARWAVHLAERSAVHLVEQMAD